MLYTSYFVSYCDIYIFLPTCNLTDNICYFRQYFESKFVIILNGIFKLITHLLSVLHYNMKDG